MTEKLRQEIQKIKERNARVEADKAWETSWTRKGIIAVATYAVAIVLFYWIKAEKPFLVALIPAAAYLLSTLTLPFAKKWWIENRALK